jgi:hypothetical protein
LKKFYALLALSVIIFLFGVFPKLVEGCYSQLIYPITSSAQRLISSLFPFAIGDFLYALLIAYALTKIFIFIAKRKRNKEDYLKFGLQCLNFMLMIYISFKLLWGLNYSRPRINEQLNISDQPYQKQQLLNLASFFLKKIDSLNSRDLRERKIKYTITELENEATLAYRQLAVKQAFFRYRFNTVKPVVSSWLVSKMGIEGYYNPLSGEANINTSLPDFVLPFVVCHEIAHQLGVAKEDEANLVGYLTSVHSSNAKFQYAAYYNMLRYVLLEIRMKYPEDYNLTIEQIPQAILDDFETEREFWAKYNGAMSVYMSKTFDKILKLNSQRKGVKSYQDIVLWLVNYHKKELQALAIQSKAVKLKN